MTEQEFYIWLLNQNLYNRFPEFNPELLRKYEISKLVLDKFGTHCLSENQQRNLNLEAVLSWFRVSDYIHLKYDIPEILELLPEKIKGDLDISYSQIESLPKLKSIEGNLDLFDSEIKSLPQLKSVGGYLNLYNSQIKSLPQLKSVGGWLNLYDSQIKSLPELKSVGNYILAGENKTSYWKNYFRETGRSVLAEKMKNR